MKVGSDREAASSPGRPNFGVDEIGTLAIRFLRGGDPPKLALLQGMYSHKIPYNTEGFSVEIVLLLAKERDFE